MTTLAITGTVREFDDYDENFVETTGRIYIRDDTGNERNLFSEAASIKWDGLVTIAILEEAYRGLIYADYGSTGYSEYTPGDPDRLFMCGGPGSCPTQQRGEHDACRSSHDILTILEDRYLDKRVTVYISDGPIDLGATTNPRSA